MRRAELAERCRLSVTPDDDEDVALANPGLMAASSGAIVAPVMVTNHAGTRFSYSIVCPSRELVGSPVGLRHPPSAAPLCDGRAAATRHTRLRGVFLPHSGGVAACAAPMITTPVTGPVIQAISSRCAIANDNLHNAAVALVEQLSTRGSHGGCVPIPWPGGVVVTSVEQLRCGAGVPMQIVSSRNIRARWRSICTC
jgi:hypothetical protein